MNAGNPRLPKNARAERPRHRFPTAYRPPPTTRTV